MLLLPMTMPVPSNRHGLFFRQCLLPNAHNAGTEMGFRRKGKLGNKDAPGFDRGWAWQAVSSISFA